MTELGYQVMVHEGVRRQREQRLPDGSPIVSSPVSSTLIYGTHDAVLVDPPFTRDQVQRVGDWVEQSGKTLTHVYATHGHGDHWFGTDSLLQRFPGAVAYATNGTIAKMHEKWFGVAPAAGSAAVTAFPGYGVPDMSGYDPTPHTPSCS